MAKALSKSNVKAVIIGALAVSFATVFLTPLLAKLANKLPSI